MMIHLRESICTMYVACTLNQEIFANSKFRDVGSNLVGRKICDKKVCESHSPR